MTEESSKESEGIIFVTEVSSDNLTIYVYKGSEDYIVSDNFCMCKSFMMNLAKGEVGCKHTRAKKKVVKRLRVSRLELYDIVTAILFYGHSNLLRKLESDDWEGHWGEGDVRLSP